MADPNAIQVVTACGAGLRAGGAARRPLPPGAGRALPGHRPRSRNSAFAFFDALEPVEQGGGQRRAQPSARRQPRQGRLWPRRGLSLSARLPRPLGGAAVSARRRCRARSSTSRPTRATRRRSAVQVARRREAQLAAMLAAEDAHVEMLTFSRRRPGARPLAAAHHLRRRASGLGELRDRVLDACGLPRHGLVLDLKAGSGLLTWEALRRVPEGGVYALARSTAATPTPCASWPNGCRSPSARSCWRGRSATCPRCWPASRGYRFDAIVGHNCWSMRRTAGRISAWQAGWWRRAA